MDTTGHDPQSMPMVNNRNKSYGGKLSFSIRTFLSEYRMLISNRAFCICLNLSKQRSDQAYIECLWKRCKIAVTLGHDLVKFSFQSKNVR